MPHFSKSTPAIFNVKTQNADGSVSHDHDSDAQRRVVSSVREPSQTRRLHPVPVIPGLLAAWWKVEVFSKSARGGAEGCTGRGSETSEVLGVASAPVHTVGVICDRTLQTRIMTAFEGHSAHASANNLLRIWFSFVCQTARGKKQLRRRGTRACRRQPHTSTRQAQKIRGAKKRGQRAT